MRRVRRRTSLCVVALSLATLAVGARCAQSGDIDRRIEFNGEFSQTIDLGADQVIEVSAGVPSPSTLPANGRIAVEWSGPTQDAGWRKIVHALDPDVYVVYRAPKQGRYQLALRAVVDEDPKSSVPRWRETGALAETKSFPQHTPWPAGHQVSVRIAMRTIKFGQATRGAIVETEPNNSIAQAQPLSLAEGDQEQVVSVTGGADDIEYFDNERMASRGTTGSGSSTKGRSHGC